MASKTEELKPIENASERKAVESLTNPRILPEGTQAQSIEQSPTIQKEQQAKTDDLESVEKILSKSLGDLFKELPPHRKEEFKLAGEKLARQALVELKIKSKNKVSSITLVRMVRDWLKLIPGINKFYLEQEAKLIADQLLLYKKQKETEA
jgi:hypothetical protein